MSAIENQWAARGERSHLRMGMGNCYSQRKGDKGKTNAGWLCIHWKNEMRSVVREREKKDEIVSEV